MGLRGEIFSTRVQSANDNRTYFLNVKENRNRDVFVTIVESKKLVGGERFERHQVVVFEDDLLALHDGLDRVRTFLADRRRGASTQRER